MLVELEKVWNIFWHASHRSLKKAIAHAESKSKNDERLVPLRLYIEVHGSTCSFDHKEISTQLNNILFEIAAN